MARKYHNHSLQNGIKKKSHTTITFTRHQEDNLSQTTSSFFHVKMIAKLERALRKAKQIKDQHRTSTNWCWFFTLDYAVVRAQNLFSSHRDSLTDARHHLIKCINFDETKKKVHDSHIASAKETLKLSHSRPSQIQASDTNQQIKALRQSCH